MLCGLYWWKFTCNVGLLTQHDYLALHVITASRRAKSVWFGQLFPTCYSKCQSKGKRLRIFSIVLSLISYVVMSQAVVRAVNGLDQYGLTEHNSNFGQNPVCY